MILAFTISQKKLGMEFIFCIQISIEASTSWYYFFFWKRPDKSITTAWKWPDKSITTDIVFYGDGKHSDLLRVSSHVGCYLFLGDCGQKCVQPFRSCNSKICYNWSDEMSWFFASYYKLLGRTLKNGGHSHHGTPKSGVSHKSFDESRRLIE